MTTNMEAKALYTDKPNKWYNNSKFSLIPQFEFRPKNYHRTNGFTFNWLCFKFWSLDQFGFELAFVATTHWGIGFNGILPYFRWVITIPLSYKVERWIDKKLGRHTQYDKDNA